MKHKMSRFSIVIFMISCMFLTLLPTSVWATEEPEIPADAIYISDAEDFIEFANNCRINTWSIGKTVVLKESIDLKGIEFDGIPTFGGTFLGRGHVIRNLNLTQAGSVVGLFRYLQPTAVVDSLQIEGVIQPKGSKSAVGAIAGNNEGLIKNCSFRGDVAGYEQVGGLVGINEVSGVIENCETNGTVCGSHFVGGIAGQNYGVIRNSINEAEVNTKSVQNSVDFEDITIDNMINTESANTATDIGGIVGISSGVVRECKNNGAVGYRNMGYNIGGIAGSQKGYIADCVNTAEVKGRKEVGGIVGHMEPNIVLEYKVDSFQTLSAQLDELSKTLHEMRESMSSSTVKLNQQMDALEKDMAKIQESLDVISKELEAEKIDTDRITAAMNSMSNATADAFEKISNIRELLLDSTSEISKQMEEVLDELDQIIGTVENIEDNLDFSITDVSGEDTEADTQGKVANCINYGKVYGQLNVGGIAGMLADETDLDAFEDIESIGEVSLNGSYRMRVVIRDCTNMGTVVADKQYVGGVAGQMLIGAIFESINLGSLDALTADYVGGIAGESHAIIRNCSSKCMMAGSKYVGGIVGSGKEVTDCYAFVSIEAYTEKAGAIMGDAAVLPTTLYGNKIYGNYYYINGKDIGGIDGISYTGATDSIDVATFMQLPELPEVFKTVKVCFKIEGKEDVILTVNVGESLALADLPVVNVDEVSEYSWRFIPMITSRALGMGEVAEDIYVSEELLTNLLFDQTYEANLELKGTVIQSNQKKDNKLSLLLAEGNFAKHTSLELIEMSENNALMNGEEIFGAYQVVVSKEGITKLHYLVPEDMDTGKVFLYVQSKNGEWTQREFTVDGSYMLFDFTDEDQAFGFIHNNTWLYSTFAVGVIIFIALIFIVNNVYLAKVFRRKK